MASDEWWTVGDDPAVFGPVVVELRSGEISRYQGDYSFARWESDAYPRKPGTVPGETLLLLEEDGETIEIGPEYVIQVLLPDGDHTGKVVIDGTWRRDPMAPMREPAKRLPPRVRPAREQLARLLPQYGEMNLAGRVLTITDTELERIGDLAGYYAWSQEALGLLGGSMGGVRAMCLATIDVLEGNLRDPRQRQSLQELHSGTPERSDVELELERSLRVRVTTDGIPRFDASP